MIPLYIAALLLAATAVPVAWSQVYQEEGVRVEVVADQLRIPWDGEFAPDGLLYLTARPGILHTIHNGTISDVLHLDVGGGEGGMLGVAVHPNYTDNRLVYVYHTRLDSGNTVVRYQYQESGLIPERVIIDGIPSSTNHNGGRISFGPDGMLYVTTGDASSAPLSRNLGSLAGKILRLTPDGAVPTDNPFEGSPVYAYGLRNPQGISWDDTGRMVSTDHGPSGFYDRAHDEINVIVPGGDYGWPESIGDRVEPGTIPPLIHSGDETWAPSGLVRLTNSSIPQWNGMILYGALRGQHLGMVSPDGSLHQKLFEGEFGRIRAPIQHPDGSVYLLTSNTDGRGLPSPDDDLLIRITAYPPIPDHLRQVASLLWEWHRDGTISRTQLDETLAHLSGLG